jgi:2-oxo-4-hydroxy-4-carboxy-5-ureidoimidazoline decarboxylase
MNRASTRAPTAAAMGHYIGPPYAAGERSVDWRTAMALSLSEVNRMSAAEFVRALGGVFEHSPWIAERALAARPFAAVGALHAAMSDAVRRAGRDAQLALLRAHPELAGKEAQAGTLTTDSAAEQAAAGLDALTREELQRFAALNQRYRERFGFPFIIAARRHGKDEIFRELERRLGLAPEAELANALEQVFAITRARLDALIPG